MIVARSIESVPTGDIRYTKICLLAAILTDKDNSLSDALLSVNSSKSQETFIEGHRVCFWLLIVVSPLHVRTWSPNLTIKTLISIKTHMRWCGSIKPLVVRCQCRLINLLGLYINTLEYTELLNELRHH